MPEVIDRTAELNDEIKLGDGYCLANIGIRVQIRVNQLWMKDRDLYTRHKPIILIIGEGDQRRTRYVGEAICMGESRTVVDVDVDDNDCTQVTGRRVCVETTSGVRYR